MRNFKFIIFLILVGIYPVMGFAKTPTIINHFGNDIVNSFANWPAFVIAGGALAAAELTQADQSIQDHFRNGPHLGKADTIAGIAGAAYVVDTSSILLYGIGKLAKDEKLALTGEAMFEALAITEVSTLGLKAAFRRTRPDGGHYSFPSGHAARCFAAATVLQTFYGLPAGIPAYLAAAFISFTRMDQNFHYASDVVFGAALGAGIGWGTALFHKKLGDKVVIVPTASNGPGLSVYYRF